MTLQNGTNGKKKNYLALFDNVLRKVEGGVTIIIAIVIIFIVAIALLRILTQTYHLLVVDLIAEKNVTFNSFIDIFSKIMTLLISIEFMKSITKVLRNHGIKSLILDVSLITALSICRKLIIYDYEQSNGLCTIAIGVVLISIGIFYFLIKHEKNKNNTEINHNGP
jgi:uncharacterized membrane protein (DUF373 family)